MGEWAYAEQILRIDLTAGTARAEETPLELKHRYIGGAGFVAGLLAPQSADKEGAKVALATGPLSGDVAGRLALGANPSCRGGMALSSLGGHMAAALKGSGYDAAVITGRLDRPGVLVVEPEGVRILPAGDLWGETVPATEAALADQMGPDYAAMVLGPAAENQVPFAALAHEGHYAGGSGVAAALGGQRIKAVLVKKGQSMPARCAACTLPCPAKLSANAQRAGDLGLDAPTAERLAALAAACSRAGVLEASAEPFWEMAHRQGVGSLLAEGEEGLLRQLEGQGPLAAALAELPPARRRKGPGLADLLGTCGRIWKERPGELLRDALATTRQQLASAV